MDFHTNQEDLNFPYEKEVTNQIPLKGNMVLTHDKGYKDPDKHNGLDGLWPNPPIIIKITNHNPCMSKIKIS